LPEENNTVVEISGSHGSEYEKHIIDLIMEAISTYETSVNFYGAISQSSSSSVTVH
jgi:hypothetical protein